MKYIFPTPQEIEAEAKAQGLSMNQVYRKAGVNKTTFWRWKRGENITMDKVKALLDALK